MAIETNSWSVREDFNKAKLKLEIPNFSDVVGKTKKLSSELCLVGRSKFFLRVYPSGHRSAEQGMLSAYLSNASNHDVVVDYTITAEGAESKSEKNSKIETGCAYGWENFMKTSKVGAVLIITVEVAVKWEDLSGGMMEENQVNGSDLKQEMKNSEESLKKEIKNLEESLKENMQQEMKNMQQEMKSVRAEIARVKTSSIPDCPVCFQKLAPPKKIVQCLKVGLQFVLGHIFPF